MNRETPPEVVLGVGAGIAAYKVCELLRQFTESGYRVRVVPTDESLRFVGKSTWEALSGRPVATGVWDAVHEVPHVQIGRGAALVFVAPATADLIAKAAHGLADDLLTNTLLTARCPIVFAPAMHTEMWEHPATQANIETLRSRGAIVLNPAVGRLTGADTGRGRLPEPEQLFAVGRGMLHRGGSDNDLAGRRVLVTAGGTREDIDPVRFLGNRSSGRQGYALAATAVARGARVVLVSANVTLSDPAGTELIRVRSAREMRDVVLGERASADAVVMAAAVADFRPGSSAEGKIKKGAGQPDSIGLVENPDILAEITRERANDHQVIVGFAAETENALEHGRAKLARKGCDLLVVNQVGDGRAFGTQDNQAVALRADGSAVDIAHGPKEDLADRVWDLVTDRLAQE